MTMTTTTTAPAGAGDRADVDALNAAALNTAAAYRAATAGAAVYESGAGRLKLTGADARDLLNRLSTNLVDPNAPAGEVTATVLTSDRGRIVDLVYVAHCGDHQLLLTGAGQQDNVAAFLDKYTIMEDIEVEDITGSTALLALTGPAAGAIVSAAAGGLADDGAQVIPLPGNPEGEGEGADGLPRYRILAPVESGGAALGRLQAAGAVAISAAAAETLRIARGRPQYGAEMGDAYNPLEAGLIGAIDFHKGCYIGQEVIARLDTYRKVQKYLVALRFDAGAGVVADLVGARLLDGAGKAMGLVTSAAVLPPDEDGDGGAAGGGGGAVIGLGYVRAAAAEVGASFGVAPAGGAAAGGGSGAAGHAQITARPLLFGGEKPAGDSR